jgi:hypothetical protein
MMCDIGVLVSKSWWSVVVVVFMLRATGRSVEYLCDCRSVEFVVMTGESVSHISGRKQRQHQGNIHQGSTAVTRCNLNTML